MTAITSPAATRRLEECTKQRQRKTIDEIIFETSSEPATDPLWLTKWRFASCCLMCLGNGLNDSMPGAVIPHMEDYYSIGYNIVAIQFATYAIGFLCAAPLTHILDARLKRGGTIIAAQLLMAAGYLMILCTPPFPAVVVAYFPIGLGAAFSLAVNNSYCANIGNASITLGIFHGSYGVGGIIGPIIATGMVSASILWSRVFAIALGLAVCNAIYGGYMFWGYQVKVQTELPTCESGRDKKVLAQAFKSRTSLLGALFIFAYQGAEVTISGWVISFLVATRGANIDAIGYVTAGFWGGITLGRLVLSPLGYWLGEKWAVISFTVGSAALQVIVWKVPSIVGDAIAVAVLGLLLGPVYPSAVATFSRLLPRDIQVTSIGIISLERKSCLD